MLRPFSMPAAQAAGMYRDYAAEKAKRHWKIQEDLKRDLEPGWMAPMLCEIESAIWGRWDYWTQIQLEGALPEQPIPEISFCGFGDARENYAVKMWRRCIDAVGGGGWGLSQNIEYILDWALFAFGHSQELPKEPQAGASMRLYQLFDLWPLLIWPYDYLGDIMAEAGIGKGQDFYPTPHELVEAMTQMTYTDDIDYRTTTVHDPCLGTGRMLLHASNYSLRLSGQDISQLACKTSTFNGFLYAPWLVKAIVFDENNNVVQSDYARMWSRVLRMEAVLREIGRDTAPVEAPPEPPPPIELIESLPEAEQLFFDVDVVVERERDRRQEPRYSVRKRFVPNARRHPAKKKQLKLEI